MSVQVFRRNQIILGISVLLFVFLSRLAQADQAITFLTSLPEPKGLQPDYAARFEKKFRKHFEGTKYVLRVRHFADQKILWNTLHDPSNVAVIWLSHAAFGASEAVVDYRGYDVKEVFSEIHPNLRFLSVIGCKTEQVFERWLAEKVSKSNPELSVQLFDKKVSASKGLKQALVAIKGVIEKPELIAGYESPCPSRVGFPVSITRSESATEPSPPTRVESSGNVLGVMSAGETDTLYFPAPVVSRFDLKLVLNAGQYVGKKTSAPRLGTLTVQPSWPSGTWEVFADENGKPIGVSQNVYRYTGILPIPTEPATYSPFACEPMPPL